MFFVIFKGLSFVPRKNTELDHSSLTIQTKLKINLIFFNTLPKGGKYNMADEGAEFITKTKEWPNKLVYWSIKKANNS